MNICGPKIIKKRKWQLENFYKKVIIRAQLNPKEHLFSDIPDGSIEYEIDLNKLEKLKNSSIQQHIGELQKNVKQYLIYRSASKILESEADYNYWHAKSKIKLIKLKKYITKKDLIQFVCYCYHHYNKTAVINYIIIGLKSNLHTLLIERESVRNDVSALLLLKQKISEEWGRLTELISLEYIVCYGLEVLKCIREQN